MAEKTRRDLEDTVVKKALSDDGFRAQLLANPRTAVEAALADEFPNAKLPANLTVKAIEEPANAMYLVVPSTPELSEQQLEAVAGGKPKWEASIKVSGGG